MKRFLTFLSVFVIILVIYLYNNHFKVNIIGDYYIACDNSICTIKDKNKIDSHLTRGTKISLSDKQEKIEDEIYYRAYIDDEIYYVRKDNYVAQKEDAVKETKGIIKNLGVLYEKEDGYEILTTLKPDTAYEIIGHTPLKDDGYVERYKIKINDLTGYLLYEDTVALNEIERSAELNSLDNPYGGGAPNDLFYYYFEKKEFENNKMPAEVKAIYLNAGSLLNIDDYLSLAKDTGINALVIDVKESNSLTATFDSANVYSKTAYKNAYLDKEEFKSIINKIKESNLYLIGRIVCFKDDYYASDHPEFCLGNKESGGPFLLNNAYWPSPYQCEVWEYNVALALECGELGFNEIQFDYLRFPDRIMSSYDYIDFKNDNNDSMVLAIEGFLLYARKQLHDHNIYLSADVFGETANNYVTAYGQYWPIISLLTDVISPMPYPSHFYRHDFGIKEVVWTVPYELLYKWGTVAQENQNRINNAAKVRTWLQGFDVAFEPATVYDADKLNDQINALRDVGFKDGYMVWNASSSLERYSSYSTCFNK